MVAYIFIIIYFLSLYTTIVTSFCIRNYDTNSNIKCGLPYYIDGDNSRSTPLADYLPKLTIGTTRPYGTWFGSKQPDLINFYFVNHTCQTWDTGYKGGWIEFALNKGNDINNKGNYLLIHPLDTKILFSDQSGKQSVYYCLYGVAEKGELDTC